MGALAATRANLGTALAPRHTGPRRGDVRHSLADISQAQAMLGYEVKVDFEQGLRRVITWYRERDG